jgi:hypothetical protein
MNLAADLHEEHDCFVVAVSSIRFTFSHASISDPESVFFRQQKARFLIPISNARTIDILFLDDIFVYIL